MGGAPDDDFPGKGALGKETRAEETRAEETRAEETRAEETRAEETRAEETAGGSDRQDEALPEGRSAEQKVSPKLLEALVCPATGARLKYDAGRGELVSHSAGLAYPIRSGIPIMLIDEARKLDD